MTLACICWCAPCLFPVVCLCLHMSICFLLSLCSIFVYDSVTTISVAWWWAELFVHHLCYSLSLSSVPSNLKLGCSALLTASFLPHTSHPTTNSPFFCVNYHWGTIANNTYTIIGCSLHDFSSSLKICFHMGVILFVVALFFIIIYLYSFKYFHYFKILAYVPSFLRWILIGLFICYMQVRFLHTHTPQSPPVPKCTECDWIIKNICS